VNFCVTIPLAAAGAGVWSPVVGGFAGSVAAIAAGLIVSPFKLRLRFDREARRRYLRFSWPIFATALALLLVQQGQVFAFNLHGGLEAAGYISLAWTLTRYADRADQIIATTIYPAIVVVRDRIATLEELFVKSNRVALMWVLPFCAGWVLFAPDLVEFVLGDEWEPAVLLLQGLAGAAAIQQLAYNWFSFYRAVGNSRPQAVESAVLAVTFLGLAVPALLIWGPAEFVAARIGGALIVFLVRLAYVRKLLPGVNVLALSARAAAPVLGASALVLLARVVLWRGDRELWQALAELVLFLVATAAFTWTAERGLLRELVAQVRSGRSLRAGLSEAAPSGGR
jgi:O-antigen/teichoic acid export membrane protein